MSKSTKVAFVWLLLLWLLGTVVSITAPRIGEWVFAVGAIISVGIASVILATLIREDKK